MTSDVHIKFLGTGSILQEPKRSCSSILIDTPKEKILVDVGPGTLHRLADIGVNPEQLNYIFITHFHPDHVSDLIPIIFAIKNSTDSQIKISLRVWGPHGFFSYLHGMEIAYGKWLLSDNYIIRFHELKRHLLDFPGLRVIWDKVLHKTESVAYRFEINHKVICVSGDTGYCEELSRLCKDSDLAILECSYPDELAVEGHLSPSLAGKIAANGNAKKLVLTHFYPGTTQSDIVSVTKKFFKGPIELAEDLKEYVL
jgi:ribonuclease BN (tRNA processing enzyme)